MENMVNKKAFQYDAYCPFADCILCIPCPGGGTHPPGYTHPLPGHAHPHPGHAHAPDIHTDPLLDISTHQKGPGTRGTQLPVDRETPVKTLPSGKFVGGQ